MTCTTCGADLAPAAKFCAECGAAAVLRCEVCSAVVSGRFCSECGAPAPAARLPAASGSAQSAPDTVTVRVAERRITSVLFGDLVGFTTLSETRDPEDVRELLSRYFTTCRTVIERYGGTVEKFIGDAVMAVWGVPVAHEDDAERAVRAGLDLVDAVAALGEQVAAEGLAMRVGVVTGDVAVNVGATGEGMVAGDSVNTAARVQTAALPGQVWVDDQTRLLTAAAVDYADAGEHELKGKAEPMRLHVARQVVAAVGGARRVDGLEAPFCGRDRELRLVKELFHATLEEGRPRLVSVFGAAGVGKSRLAWEFDKYTDGISDVVMAHRGRCLSYGEGVAFWALAEMVQGRLGILEGDPTHVIVERLSAGLEHYVTDPSDRDWLRPRLATLLGVGDQVTPGASFARDDLFAAWRTFLEQVAVSEDAAGAFLRIDDLQWADRGLLDFIEHVVETARVPLFILTLARSELTESAPTFGTGRRATALHLEPLPSPAMATLVDGLVEGLPDTLREALVERAEGVPLFAVETVRSLIDRDVVVPRDGRYVFADDGDVRVDLAQESLPTSLHTLIASRLDGLLPQERRLVQDAAVLGQAFSLAGLSALVAATGDDIDVAPALDALVRKEIIAVESDPRSPERGQYRFVQATVRTVAYDTLSRRDRKARHICAAEHLAQEPDADTIPAVIAAHYVDAHAAAAADEDADELAAKAVELLERAAVRASDLGAPAEARRHFETAMSLVSEPTEVARLSVAAAAAAISAGATEDAASLADRAREQYEQAGLATDAARALAVWGDAMIAAGTGQEVVEPLSVAYEQLPDLPQNAATRAQLALGVARGYYLSKGESQEAIPWFDRAVALAEALDELPLLVQTLSSYAGALVLVGRSRMGLGLLRVSLDLARELDDPKLQLRPLNNLVSFLATRDLRGSLAYAEEALAIVRRLGDREWGDFVASSAAHAHWNSGAWDELPQIAQGATQMEHTSPSRTLLFCYRACVDEARGTPVELPTDTTPEASRTDVLVQALHSLAEAFRRRAESDVVGAAAASRSAAQLSYSSAGIDDDFALFWMQAMADQLAVGDLPSAQDVFALVAEAPRGHVSPLLRALLPWMQARVKLLEDPQADVGASFVAAASALRSFGATYYLARTLLDHAQWLDEQHRPAEALPLLEEARELFSALGARPWVDRSSGRSSARLTQGVRAGT